MPPMLKDDTRTGSLNVNDKEALVMSKLKPVNEGDVLSATILVVINACVFSISTAPLPAISFTTPVASEI